MVTKNGSGGSCVHKTGLSLTRASRAAGGIPMGSIMCPRCVVVSSLILVANGCVRVIGTAVPAPRSLPAFVHGPRIFSSADRTAVCRAKPAGRWMSSTARGGDKNANFLRTLTKLKALNREGDKEMDVETPDHMEILDELSQGGKVDPNKTLERLLASPGAGKIDELLKGEEDEYKFEGEKRCGTVAIVGAPNAGKSTLLNHLIGSKLAIVTHKKQTTRNTVTGIAMEEGTQIIYLDTPGIMDARPHQRLNKAMVKSAWNSARDADEIFFIIDTNKILPGFDRPGKSSRKSMDEEVDMPAPEELRLREKSNEELIMRRLCERGQPFNLILNKVDQLKGQRKDMVLLLAEGLKMQAAKQDGKGSWVKRVFAVSAMNGKGLNAIRNMLREGLPKGPWHYPPDQISDIPLRNIVAEITRESIMLRAHEEVPYSSYVETESFEEKPDGSVRIAQMIYCETEGQKKILVGMVKDLGIRSRIEMSKFLEKPVHLLLNVKVRKWTDSNKGMYERLGLDFDA